MPKPTKGAIWLALEERKTATVLVGKRGEEMAKSSGFCKKELSMKVVDQKSGYFFWEFEICRWKRMVWKINNDKPPKKPNKTWGNAHVAIVFVANHARGLAMVKQHRLAQHRVRASPTWWTWVPYCALRPSSVFKAAGDDGGKLAAPGTGPHKDRVSLCIGWNYHPV